MVNKVLVDTNVLLDYTLTREKYFCNADRIVSLCADGILSGCIAANSIANMYYVMRKDVEPHKRREILITMCMIFEVIEIGEDKILAGLNNRDFPDFEDCLQVECAKEFGADYIITRNIKDFKASTIKVVTPEEFLTRCNAETSIETSDVLNKLKSELIK